CACVTQHVLDYHSFAGDSDDLGRLEHGVVAGQHNDDVLVAAIDPSLHHKLPDANESVVDQQTVSFGVGGEFPSVIGREA
ncbi:hypothetical protein A2U01_0082606, partial [Trifolium medium]|nr:hypothetical protein [Trifolium medium]